METTIARSEIIRKLDNISDLIGNTPLIRLENLEIDKEIRIYAKAEWLQFGGGTKARAAYSIIRHAILSGELDENRCLLDASTGNMAIAYATIAAKLNIPVKFCLPVNTPVDKLKLLELLGAEIHLSPDDDYFEGARNEAARMYSENPDKYFYANQFSNENYWKAHYYTTAEEIIEQTNGEVTHFVTGIGNTGAFTGVASRLKSHNRRLQVVALNPDNSTHNQENWGQIETAQNSSFHNPQLADYELSISFPEAKNFSKEIAKKEGLILSASSAANVFGALKIAGEINLGTIVTIISE